MVHVDQREAVLAAVARDPVVQQLQVLLQCQPIAHPRQRVGPRGDPQRRCRLLQLHVQLGGPGRGDHPQLQVVDLQRLGEVVVGTGRHPVQDVLAPMPLRQHLGVAARHQPAVPGSVLDVAARHGQRVETEVAGGAAQGVRLLARPGTVAGGVGHPDRCNVVGPGVEEDTDELGHDVIAERPQSVQSTLVQHRDLVAHGGQPTARPPGGGSDPESRASCGSVVLGSNASMEQWPADGPANSATCER